MEGNRSAFYFLEVSEELEKTIDNIFCYPTDETPEYLGENIKTELEGGAKVFDCPMFYGSLSFYQNFFPDLEPSGAIVYFCPPDDIYRGSHLLLKKRNREAINIYEI